MDVQLATELEIEMAARKLVSQRSLVKKDDFWSSLYKTY